MSCRRGALLAAAVTSLIITGCNAPNLSKRELVVHFAGDATAEQHRAALENCTGVADNTSPEPMRHDPDLPTTYLTDVRFRIDHANDRDIAMLETCLAKQPGVVGAEDTSGLTR